MKNIDPVALALVLGMLSLIPLLVVSTTSFLKISIVLSLVRNGIGVQQSPPNIALYGLSLLLTLYIMAPVGSEIADAIGEVPDGSATVQSVFAQVKKGAEPLRKFLTRNSKVEQRDFFMGQAKRMWPQNLAADVKQDDFLIVAPAFVVSELTAAFAIGFLLCMPFIVIDLVVSNILMAMGMMMVSPVTISLPLKLFLFVMVDGWSRLMHGLVLTYTV
jgi:type III secretion protein R